MPSPIAHTGVVVVGVDGSPASAVAVRGPCYEAHAAHIPVIVPRLGQLLEVTHG
jgi:hypothetical protein